MASQFENPQETKVEEQTETPRDTTERVEKVADKLARKAGESEKKFDAENHIIFSK